MNGLPQFLATLRSIQPTDYGDVGEAENGVRPFGAYGMLMEDWESWSSAAGMGGHDKFDPAAQDYVAAFWGQKLFSRYGSWDMVAAAWFAGAEQTDRAAQSDQGIGWFKHPKTRQWLDAYTQAQEDPVVQEARMPRAGGKWINPQGAPKGWLMPVAGANEYSNSFFVPRDNKAGIHGAIDLYAKKGTPIVAPVGGTVIAAGYGEKGGYTARIRGDDGLTYYFAHMDGEAVVKNGERIGAGSHLGFVGDSGNARGTSPHLHFSIRKGSTIVNPYTYLQGSKNAGNYYSPGDAAHAVEGQPTTKSKLTSFLTQISNQVAGGERTDYRTLGQGLVEGDESNETTDGEVMV
ncbi:MAG: M23 family metallopeptidase [Actinomycetota bacterium]